MLKKLAVLALSVMMLLLFGGCSADGRDEQVIYPIDKDPEFLDPQIVSSEGARNIIANCFEGLVTVDADGKIIPGCAESWKVSDDGLVYTFHLRDNCQWRISTYAATVLGKEAKEPYYERVTAEDFAFALRRALRPETKSPGAKNLYSIKNAVKVHQGTMGESSLGVKAANDRTLVISLEWADPDFLYSLLDAVCMPCNEEFFKATGGRYGLAIKYLIYNGPFYISNWADDTAITLKRSEGYYDSENVAPASVYFSMNNEQSTRLEKILDGIYQVAPLTSAQARELSETPKYSVNSYSSTVLSFLFNCKEEVFSNVNIRRAVAAGIDLEAVEERLGKRTAGGIIPGSMVVSGESYRESAGKLELYSHKDPAGLLDKGLKEITKNSIEFTVLCSAEHESLIRTLIQTWQARLGVRAVVTVEVLDDITLRQRVEDGKYQMAFYPLSYSSVTAFNGLLRFTTDNANNVCNFSDTTYDNTVGVIKTVNGQQATMGATRNAEEYLLSSCVLVPLYEQTENYGISKGVSGVIFNPTGETLYFRNTLVK